MSRRNIVSAALTGVLAVFSIAACADVVEPDRLSPDDALAATFGSTLVECPTNEEKSVRGVIDALGGSIRLDNHELMLPALAVIAPTEFELRARASNYMELRVRANDVAGFTFDQPATITIDYSRCTRSNIDKDPLTVWKIDPVTKQLLQHMGGVDDKAARTVTFQTETLSTFSIAR